MHRVTLMQLTEVSGEITDGLQTAGESVDSEKQEPEKQDVPEQLQSESAETNKSQVCNATETVSLSFCSAERNYLHRVVKS